MNPYSVGLIEKSSDIQAGKSFLPTPYYINQRGTKFAEQVREVSHVFRACSATNCLSEGFTPSPGNKLGVKVAGFPADSLPIFMAALTGGGPQSQHKIVILNG